MDLKEKKVLVIGLGVSGRAAAKFLMSKGAEVWAVEDSLALIESNPEIAQLCMKGMKALQSDSPLNVTYFDLVVASPGVAPSQHHYREAKSNKVAIIGEIELACRYVNNPCVGITGTNGKTTVTLLIAHILNKSGFSARALGNVGVPLTTELLTAVDPDEIFVLELSSYQLETLETKVLDSAVILNITPDHLDRYGTMEDYAKAKIKIENCLKPKAQFFCEDKTYLQFYKLFSNQKPSLYGYSANCAIHTDLEHVFDGEKIAFGLPAEFKGKISHDVENILAAWSICKSLGVSGEQFLAAFKTFKKPPHRIEFVTNVKGVDYYDDSKGTNIDAVIRAVNTLNGHLILIAGGVDKGAAYSPWVDSFMGKVRCVCAIGQAAKKIKNDLSPSVPVELFPSLEAAVKHAAEVAKPGDSVLLSPGCSSFDMFKDYAHRGDEFKKIVNLLRGEVI